MPFPGVNVPRWRAGKITKGEASIVIALLMYNTVLIDRASVDPRVGQADDLAASSILPSQLGNIVGLDLPISFTSNGGVVRFWSSFPRLWACTMKPCHGTVCSPDLHGKGSGVCASRVQGSAHKEGTAEDSRLASFACST